VVSDIMGKKIIIVAGILCLLGSFVFAWLGDSSTVFNGLGIINIGEAINMLNSSGEPLFWIGFILGLLTIFSGIFILIGRKSRALPIIFGLVAFVQMLIIILLLFEIDIPYLSQAVAYPVELFFLDPIGGIFPILIEPFHEIGLGAYFLCAGGLLAFIGGLTNKKK
jgi:hypothetical protein